MKLKNISDREPGFTRIRRGRGFQYSRADGQPCSADEVARCKKLVIPPAWDHVWICSDPLGQIQVTGIDGAGRKQYRYHQSFREQREAEKFEQLADFGKALPRIRLKAQRCLENAEPGEREFAIAAAISLLDLFPIRVGSKQHFRQNKTRGLTTLARQNVRIDRDEDRIFFKYRAKGGKRVQRSMTSKRLCKLVDEVRRVPGDALFTYVTDNGEIAELSGTVINEWLHDVSGLSTATAKSFRTWAGTIAAYHFTEKQVRTEKPITIKGMAEAASERLTNTPAIARSSYIHPRVIELTEDESGRARVKALLNATSKAPNRMRAVENRFLSFVQG
ncbi:MAG: DNA topoisomerase IB [Pseudomonadota bacterium]